MTNKPRWENMSDPSPGQGDRRDWMMPESKNYCGLPKSYRALAKRPVRAAGAVSLRDSLEAFPSDWLMPRFECAEHYKNSWLNSLERAVTADSLRFDATEELAARH